MSSFRTGSEQGKRVNGGVQDSPDKKSFPASSFRENAGDHTDRTPRAISEVQKESVRMQNKLDNIINNQPKVLEAKESSRQ